MLPLELQQWLYNEGYDWHTDESVSGGDSCANLVCRHPNGDTIFVKYMGSAPPNFFECESEGLAYLSQISNIRTPKVFACSSTFLVLEHIRANQHVPDFWEQLGHQLASVHQFTRGQYGFVNDNYCGLTHQVNTLTDDASTFFAEYRLLSLAEKAFDGGLLAIGDLQAIESLCLRLDNIIPEQPASLLHGDLWSGNVHVSEVGRPVLIDPAVYFGWAEIDIAMTRLFGGFDKRFYDAYIELVH